MSLLRCCAARAQAMHFQGLCLWMEAELDANSRKQLGLEAGEGVRITGVTGNSARESQLVPGLVILQVGRKPVGSAAELNQALRGVKAGDVVMLLVRNPRGGTAFATVTAGADD